MAQHTIGQHYNYSSGATIDSRTGIVAANMRYVTIQVTEVAGTSTIVDWVRVRKSQATDPTTSVGSQVVNAPDITSLGSSSGCVGSSITINGTNLSGATAANVKIGGTPVTAITTNTSTQIVATIGNGTTGFVTVTTAGGTATSPGNFTVNTNTSIALSSVTGTDAQIVCAQTAIANIVYTVSGSGATVVPSGLPAGVTGILSGNTYTISGNPNVQGNYNYTLNVTGSCSPSSVGGSITVNQIPTGTLTATETSGTNNNDNVICAGATVTFNATAGFALYKFYKTNAANVTTVVQNASASPSYSSSSLNNGDKISVEVFNSGNCATFFAPVTITVNPLPVPTLVSDKSIICAGDAVTFTAGGGTNYTFKVNGSAVQSGPTATYTTTTLAAGQTVTVDVTDGASCTATSAPVNVTVNPVPSGTLSASATTICAGNPVTFTATAGFTNYDFRINGTTAQSSGSNSFSTNTITNGQVVTVVVKNASNCFSTFNAIAINVNPLPAGSLTASENSGVVNDNTICAGDNVTFTATTGFNNYKFYLNGAGAALQNSASNTYNTTSLSTNDYITVVVTNNNNCQSTFTSPTIIVNALPTGTLSAGANPICAGDNVVFTASPITGATYNFKVNGVSKQNTSSNTYSTTALVNGDNVTVDVINTNGCLKTFNAIVMVVNALPTGTLAITETSGTANDDAKICAGASVTFTAPVGFSNYDFRINGTTVQSGGTRTLTRNNLADNDVVSVIVKNSTNCFATLNSYTMTVNPLPAVQPITGTFSVCVNSTTALADATGGGTWSSSNNSIATVTSGGVVTGVSAGNVTISYSVTNGNNCNTVVTAGVTVNPVPTVSAITGTPNVCVGSTRQLSDATSGGSWMSNNTVVATVSGTGLVSGLTAGTATISYTVTNGFTCSTTVSLTITVNALPAVAPIGGTLTVCAGLTTPLSDGTPGGTWSSGNTAVATISSTTGLVTGVSAGSATINYAVTNGNGCSTVVSAMVTVYALPMPTLSGPNPICPNSTATYTTESGQSNYIWTFTGGTKIAGGSTTDDFITILWDQPGARTVYINYTNANGCSAATSATVTTSAGTLPSLSGSTPVCLNSNGTYNTQAGQTNYLWSYPGGTLVSGGTTSDASVTIQWTSPGSQNVSINFTDASGCTAAAPTVLPVTVHTLPTATIGGTASVCKNSSPAPMITFTGASGAAPYTFTYTINGGANQMISTVSGSTVSISAPTGTVGAFTYALVSVADNNSCNQAQTGTATITVNPLPTASIAGTAAVCTNGLSPVVTFTGLTGTAPFQFSYNINGGATQTVTTASGNSVTISAPTAAAGSFAYNLLSVADANTCSQLQAGTATITVNPLPTATISGTTAVCRGAASPNITFTGASGSTPYTFTYNINGGGNLTVASGGAGNTATVAAPTGTAGSFTYNLVSVKDGSSTACVQAQSGSAIITVDPTSVGGTVASGGTVCYGSNGATLNLTGNTGNVVRWEFSTDAGNTWSPIANTTTSYTYTNITQTTRYRAVVQSGSCSIATSSFANIDVNPATVGGSVGASSTVCSGNNTGNLNLTGNTGSVLRWEKSIDGGATWVSITNTTTSQSYSNITQTTLYRAVVQSGLCAVVNSASATITVNPLPTATISGTTTVCQNAPSPVVTFTGANGTAPYTFTYKINAGGNLTVVSAGNVATVTAPTNVAGTFIYTLVSVKDASATLCSQTQGGSATITVAAPPAAPNVTPTLTTICIGGVVPLNAGTSPVSGNPKFSSGDINIAIPDFSATGAANTISVSGIPAGATITGISVQFRITHTSDRDLTINLKSPNAHVLNLVTQRGGTSDNFTNTTINSTSGISIAGQSAPFSGVYAPDARIGSAGATVVPGNVSDADLFSDLYSIPNGNWVFSARDSRNNNTGTINNWSITISWTLNSVPQSAIWSPATDLYTDAGATTPYTGTSVTTVYAKPSSAGNKVFTATITNGAGCSNSATATINVNPLPVVNITADYCISPGKVRLTASSVPSGATYLWSTGQTGSSIDVDIADVYDVVATLPTGCYSVASISVAQELVVNGDFSAGNTGFTSDYYISPMYLALIR